MSPRALALLAPLLALSACSESAPPADADREPAEASTAPNAQALAKSEPIVPAALPAPFLGRWDASAVACGSPASEMRLTILPDRLVFHESVARIEAIRPAGPTSLTLDLAFEGEGARWSETRTISRRPDGRLTIEGPGSAATRVSCGADTASPARWEIASSGEGDALYIPGEGEDRKVTLFCAEGSGDLLVNVPAFRPVGSEERMAFGSGETVTNIVADPAGDRQRGGVTGRGPVPDLAAILGGRSGISVNYGRQNSGPWPSPPETLAATFLAGCRD